jgi:hypothetical protein
MTGLVVASYISLIAMLGGIITAIVAVATGWKVNRAARRQERGLITPPEPGSEQPVSSANIGDDLNEGLATKFRSSPRGNLTERMDSSSDIHRSANLAYPLGVAHASDDADMSLDRFFDRVTYEVQVSVHGDQSGPLEKFSASGRGETAFYTVTKQAAIDREQAAAIREWARSRGYKIDSEERIPADAVAGAVADVVGEALMLRMWSLWSPTPEERGGGEIEPEA